MPSLVCPPEFAVENRDSIRQDRSDRKEGNGFEVRHSEHGTRKGETHTLKLSRLGYRRPRLFDPRSAGEGGRILPTSFGGVI
jgi:hypothetical protein